MRLAMDAGVRQPGRDDGAKALDVTGGDAARNGTRDTVRPRTTDPATPAAARQPRAGEIAIFQSTEAGGPYGDRVRAVHQPTQSRDDAFRAATEISRSKRGEAVLVVQHGDEYSPVELEHASDANIRQALLSASLVGEIEGGGKIVGAVGIDYEKFLGIPFLWDVEHVRTGGTDPGPPIEWYEAEASTADPDAMAREAGFEVGRDYVRGEHGVYPRTAESMSYFRAHPEAGWMPVNGQDYLVGAQGPAIPLNDRAAAYFAERERLASGG